MSIFLVKQLERDLSLQVKSLYSSLLEHEHNHVTCQIQDDKLLISIDQATTKLEKLLISRGKTRLAKQVRQSLNDIIRSQIKPLIETASKAEIIDLFVTFQPSHDRITIMVVFKHQLTSAESSETELSETEFSETEFSETEFSETTE